jgi:rhodanese-related sulfurtransferase
MVPSCAEGGVLGVLCASIGSIQVNEAIKLVAGIGEPLVGRLMIYDALEMTYRTVNVRKDPECAVCGKNPTITELIDYDAFCGAVSEEAAEAAMGSTISAKDLAAMIDAGDNIFLVDVREPNEYEIVSIPGATLIPKGEFLSGAALEQLPQDKRIVLHCKSGARSAEALAIVKNGCTQTCSYTVTGGCTERDNTGGGDPSSSEPCTTTPTTPTVPPVVVEPTPEPENPTTGHGCKSGVAISAYPNPFQDHVTLEWTASANERARLEIYDMRGNRIATLFDGNVTKGQKCSYEWTAHGCKDPFYQYKLTTSKSVTNGKLVVKR